MTVYVPFRRASRFHAALDRLTDVILDAWALVEPEIPAGVAVLSVAFMLALVLP